RPRPFPGAATGMAGGGMQITGGIAGVASKVEKQAIKIYNERDQYNEWEFIYDFTKDRTGAGQLAGTMGAGDPRLSQQGVQPGFGTQPGFGSQPGFGAQPGFGGQSGFGGQPGMSAGFGGISGQQAPGATNSNSSTGGIGSGFGGGIGSGFGGGI